MKASNSKNATPAQFLEYLRESKGIEHARHMRDTLGWRWKPSAIYWTLRRYWMAWVVAAGSFVVWLTGILSNVGLLG